MDYASVLIILLRYADGVKRDAAVVENSLISNLQHYNMQRSIGYQVILKQIFCLAAHFDFWREKLTRFVFDMIGV